ncbi:MAG: molecular chaperone GrpE [Patescibacteria group bacterium]|nr:molecular chaperone GrpE [Patescibacteria group bacterium]
MENKEKYKLSAVVKAVMYDEKQDKFLLLEMKDKGSYFVKNYGQWSFPGGKLDPEESLKEALGREIREELGEVGFEIVAPLNTVKASSANDQAVYIDYLVKYSGGKIILSKEHNGYTWEAAENIEKNAEYKSWMKKSIAKAVWHMNAEKYLEGWKRCQADFENYKKRQADSQKELVAFGNMNLILEILPVLDNFYASTGHVPESEKSSPWVTGIMHIQKQLEKVLEDNGVKEIVVKTGDDFDPSVMEAVSHEARNIKHETKENRVKKVLQKGYRIDERVIRAARVTVE